jgi:FkbM family methyltransferase
MGQLPLTWSSLKDAMIRAGFEPWLRPIVEAIRGNKRDEDDIATRAIIARLAPEAVCVDVGCHKGLYLDPMRRQATRGLFFAFEPIPYLYDLLSAKYRNDSRVKLFNMALSAASGSAELFINATDMGLSGLNKREGRSGIDRDRLRKVVVPVGTLDEVLGDRHIDFIKIDVEGAEFDVLRGARRILESSRPLILFEFGLGGAEYFGVDADKMFDYFGKHDFAVYTVATYARNGEPLGRSQFQKCFELNSAYNFIAAPRPKN